MTLISLWKQQKRNYSKQKKPKPPCSTQEITTTTIMSKCSNKISKNKSNSNSNKKNLMLIKTRKGITSDTSNRRKRRRRNHNNNFAHIPRTVLLAGNVLSRCANAKEQGVIALAVTITLIVALLMKCVKPVQAVSLGKRDVLATRKNASAPPPPPLPNHEMICML